MNQLLLGATLPFVICLSMYALQRQKNTLRFLLVTPGLMILGAGWAIVPDLPRVLGMHELYTTLSQSAWCDIFFWHYSIDLMEADEPSPAYTGLLFLYGFILLRIGMKRLKALEAAR